MAYESPSGRGTATGDGGNVVGWDDPVAPAAWIGLVEASGAVGVFPGCELGAGVRILGVHGEGRCQILGYRNPDPVAVAVSAGGGAWIYGMGPYARLGVDTTLSLGDAGLLLGGYARYGRRVHAFTSGSLPEDPDYESGHCCDVFPSDSPQLQVEQTELRLSVPVGVAWLAGRSSRRKNATRLVLGVVPSFVVHAADRTSDCADHCEPGLRATGYDEDFTVAMTARVEWGGTD
jgi:hypothetical protein